MGKWKPVALGELSFKSEAAAKRHFKQMLNSYKPGDRVSDANAAELSELLKRHPDADAKIGEGIDHFEVISHAFNSQCFAVFRTDGSFEDFSYTWAVSEG